MLQQLAFAFVLFFSSVLFSSPKIAIVTLSIGDNYTALVKKALANKALYAEKHGYDLICGTYSLDPSRHPAWSKILLIQEHLSHYDWIFWSDADSLIMNMDVTLDRFLDNDYPFIVGDTPAGINTGQFFIKNCPESFQLLEECYNLTQFIAHPWWENAAMIYLLETRSDLAQYFKLVPQREFNSGCIETAPELIDNLHVIYQPGDFIVHFAGARGPFLEEIIEKYDSLIPAKPVSAPVSHSVTPKHKSTTSRKKIKAIKSSTD